MRYSCQLHRIRCPVLLTVTSIFWVHGFLFPSFHVRWHESSYTEKKPVLACIFVSTVSTPEVNRTFAKAARRRTWHYYYPKLKQFYEKHGHSNPTKEDDKDLYKYVKSLRRNYHSKPSSNLTSMITLKSKRILPDEKLQALTDIEFSWPSCPPSPTVRPGGRTW